MSTCTDGHSHLLTSKGPILLPHRRTVESRHYSARVEKLPVTAWGQVLFDRCAITQLGCQENKYLPFLLFLSLSLACSGLFLQLKLQANRLTRDCFYMKEWLSTAQGCICFHTVFHSRTKTLGPK